MKLIQVLTPLQLPFIQPSKEALWEVGWIRSGPTFNVNIKEWLLFQYRKGGFYDHDDTKPYMVDFFNFVIVLGAIMAHVDIMGDMDVVLQRMRERQRLDSCGRLPPPKPVPADMHG